MRVGVLAFAVLLLGIMRAHAADPWIGRWAEETKFCTKAGRIRQRDADDVHTHDGPLVRDVQYPINQEAK